MSRRAASVVLVLDDDPHVLSALKRAAFGEQFDLRLCTRVAEAERVLEAEEIEVALVDQNLGADEPSGLDVLARLRDRDPDCFRIIFTGAADLAFAVNAINQGLIDAFLVKPWSDEVVTTLLNQGCETTLLRRHNRELGRELAARNAELERLNQHLETLVDERTHDLRTTLDRLREQQQELVRLETQATIAQLVRGLAHELNNPLASILGYAQRLRRKLSTDADVTNRLDVILQEVDRCCSLVEQLRNFAQPLDEEIISCRPEEALRLATQRLLAAGRHIPPCSIAAPLPRVMAAPRSLVRVFEHILDNARLAGASTCALTAQVVHGRIRLLLCNDGETPDEQVLRDATRPFFTTHSNQGHRGLGLSIAASLLREQAGQIGLERRGDGTRGACTIVTLPAPTLSDPPSSCTRPGIAADAAVLVVDDEPLVAELLADSLQEAALSSVRVGSVTEALATAARQPLRAVLADLHLPDGSGIDLVKRLIREYPALKGHVAILTGSSDGEALQKIRTKTGLPVIGKPFHLDDIARLIRDIA
jgi:two-component system NtrC family sensor kinase